MDSDTTPGNYYDKARIYRFRIYEDGALVHDFVPYSGGQKPEETEHQSLRLYQHGQHIAREGKLPFSFYGVCRNHKQKQAEHAVHLPPGGAVDDEGRIEGQYPAENGGVSSVHPAEVTHGKPVYQPACRYITEGRDKPEHHAVYGRAPAKPSGYQGIKAKNIGRPSFVNIWTFIGGFKERIIIIKR